MSQLVTIKDNIEKARQKLHQLELQYEGLRHPKVLEQSMYLDELINKYNRLLYRNDANASESKNDIQDVL